MSRVSIILAIAAVIGLAGWLATNSPHAKAPPPQKKETPSVLVTLTKLNKGSLPRTVTAFGTVETNPKAKQTVMAPFSAIVSEIYVKPDEEVSKGTPLIRLGPSPRTAAAYAKAVSALLAAHALVQHTQDLLKQHLATQQQLADAQKSATDAQASLAALKAEGAASAQTLRAPFPSIVTGISAAPGALVNEGTALLNLVRPNDLILRAGIVPQRANEVRIGDTAKVTSLGSANIVSGKVTLRGSLVDSRTGLVPIDIALPSESLLPGETAKAEITTGKVEGYVVPHKAVLVSDNGIPYVVQSANMVARKILIRVLLSAGATDVVVGPLDPMAPLVLSGNYQLENGMKVRIATPNATGKR